MISTETKRCPDCGLTLPVNRFYSRRNRGEGNYVPYCKECSKQRVLDRQKANPKAHNDYQNEWNRKNRFKASLQRSRADAKRKGHEPCSATAGEIKESFTGYCHLCGAEEKKKKLCMDHCHETGTFREWLCTNCNRGLGCFHDTPELLTRAAEYLGE